MQILDIDLDNQFAVIEFLTFDAVPTRLEACGEATVSCSESEWVRLRKIAQECGVRIEHGGGSRDGGDRQSRVETPLRVEEGDRLWVDGVERAVADLRRFELRVTEQASGVRISEKRLSLRFIPRDVTFNRLCMPRALWDALRGTGMGVSFEVAPAQWAGPLGAEDAADGYLSDPLADVQLIGEEPRLSEMFSSRNHKVICEGIEIEWWQKWRGATPGHLRFRRPVEVRQSEQPPATWDWSQHLLREIASRLASSERRWSSRVKWTDEVGHWGGISAALTAEQCELLAAARARFEVFMLSKDNGEDDSDD